MPSEIHYLTGDATAPIGDGPKVIVHVCNDIGAWGKGFVLALSKRWKQPASEFKRWYAERKGLKDGVEAFALGAVQFVKVEDDVWVANMVAQHGLSIKAGVIPLRYDALKTALTQVGAFCREHGASAHMPRIGCGLAGGTWPEVEAVIQTTLVEHGVDVSVYDYQRPS